jgi:hypothetical protein
MARPRLALVLRSPSATEVIDSTPPPVEHVAPISPFARNSLSTVTRLAGYAGRRLPSHQAPDRLIKEIRAPGFDDA